MVDFATPYWYPRSDGKIVLADRYFYTSLARDSVRGSERDWLENLFLSMIRPDLVRLRSVFPLRCPVWRGALVIFSSSIPPIFPIFPGVPILF